MSDEMTDIERATAILEPLIEADTSDDDMVIALIQSGFKFSVAGRMLNRVLESKGLRTSSKDRFAAIEEHLANWGFAPESWDDVDSAADALAEEVENTSKAQAVRGIQKYAKQNGIELPAKPKGTGGGTRVNVFDRFYAWARQNPGCTDEQIGDFVASLEVTEKQAEKYTGRFTGIMAFARELNA